jgi:hypothetical protein
MAKTLTVNITPILKKESRKTKKIKKKMHFPVFSAKKDSFAGKSACLARCRQNESTKKSRAHVQLRFLKREEAPEKLSRAHASALLSEERRSTRKVIPAHTR